MSILSNMSFHFDLNFTEEEKKRSQEYLERKTIYYAEEIFNQKIKVYVDIYDGSVLVRIGIIGSIYIAIGQYADFRSGIDQIIQDTRIIQNVIESTLNKNGIPEDCLIKKQKLIATPEKIRRLFLRIDRLEKNTLNKDEYQKELNIILKNVIQITYEMDKQDLKTLLLELKEEYRPEPKYLPEEFKDIKINDNTHKVYTEVLPFFMAEREKVG